MRLDYLTNRKRANGVHFPIPSNLCAVPKRNVKKVLIKLALLDIMGTTSNLTTSISGREVCVWCNETLISTSLWSLAFFIIKNSIYFTQRWFCNIVGRRIAFWWKPLAAHETVLYFFFRSNNLREKSILIFFRWLLASTIFYSVSWR